MYNRLSIYTIWNKGDNSLLFKHFPSPPPRAGKTIRGVDCSLGSAVLWGSNLDRVRGILDGMCTVCIMTCKCLSWRVQLLFGGHYWQGLGELECVTAMSLAEPVDSDSELSKEVYMVWNFTFLKKWWFLILPDPSTLIWYWRSGRSVMILPVTFHWWLSWFCIATISPFWRGWRL